jgi:hypothetical protein
VARMDGVRLLVLVLMAVLVGEEVEGRGRYDHYCCYYYLGLERDVRLDLRSANLRGQTSLARLRVEMMMIMVVVVAVVDFESVLGEEIWGGWVGQKRTWDSLDDDPDRKCSVSNQVWLSWLVFRPSLLALVRGFHRHRHQRHRHH